MTYLNSIHYIDTVSINVVLVVSSWFCIIDEVFVGRLKLLKFKILFAFLLN